MHLLTSDLPPTFMLNFKLHLALLPVLPQKYNPAGHTIIEAHPDVYAHMCQHGWDKKPGVKILFGRWQDVAGQLGQYDGIFFGTHMSGWSEWVLICLLARWQLRMLSVFA